MKSPPPFSRFVTRYVTMRSGNETKDVCVWDKRLRKWVGQIRITVCFFIYVKLNIEKPF